MKRRLVLAALTLAGCKPQPDWRALAAGVEVVRDTWGVPHIYAHDPDDALFAAGYETAQDRFFQLELNRRRARGTAAELLGTAWASDDRLARTLGFRRLGEEAAADLHANDPEVHRALSAYAAGISRVFAEGTLPDELRELTVDQRPEAWTVADTLAVLKAQLFVLAAHPQSDLLSFAITAGAADGAAVARDLMRPTPLERVYVTPGFPDGVVRTFTPRRRPARPRDAEAATALAQALVHWSGRPRAGPTGASNNWALCPRRTAGGGTMLANDPHLGIELPSNLYELHFEADGDRPLRAAGFGIPGLPAFVTGHNADVAWGVTTGEADDADSYLELLQGDSVLFQGGLVPVQAHDETMRVRQPDGSVVEETLHIRVVPHHGPIISDAVPEVKLLLGAKAISIRWTGFGVTHEPRAYHDLFRARSSAEVMGALNHFEAGLLNFVWATGGGDIGYYPHAIYPVRARLDPNYPPYGVLPGTGNYEWTGAQIPDARIPRLLNPDACRVFTANNDPVGTSDDGDLLNDAFYLGGTFDYGLRARRISDRLEAMGPATFDDFEALQGDVHDGLAEHFVPLLLAAAPGHVLSARTASLLAALTGWNREDAADQVAPTVFSAFYAQLILDVFKDDLGVAFDLAASDDRMFAGALEKLLQGQALPSGHDYLGGAAPADVLVQALDEAGADLEQALGTDRAQWTWGRVHTATMRHPMGGRYDLGPYPLPGGLSTVNAARYAPIVDGAVALRPEVFEAPNVRALYALESGKVTMRAALPTGQSGAPGAAHATDQLSLWKEAHTREAWFERDAVQAHAEGTVRLPVGFPLEGAEH